VPGGKSGASLTTRKCLSLLLYEDLNVVDDAKSSGDATPSIQPLYTICIPPIPPIYTPPIHLLNTPYSTHRTNIALPDDERSNLRRHVRGSIARGTAHVRQGVAAQLGFEHKV